MNDELIHKWLDGAANDMEMNELAAAMDDEAFAYVLLESELAIDHRPPLRIVIPSGARRGIQRITLMLSGAAAVILIGVVALMVFHAGPRETTPGGEPPPWYIAEIERPGSDLPVAPFVVPTGAERGVALAGGQKGGTNGAPGASPKEGFGGTRKDPHLEKALETFARQFTFTVRFPEGLPTDYRLQGAKRLIPGGVETETALLTYVNGNRKIVILEGAGEMTSQGLPASYRWHQRTVGNLRITCLGIGFDAPAWDALISSIHFDR